MTPKAPLILCHDFQNQAAGWSHKRRVIAKVEWHRGERFPRVGFIVTNLTRPAKAVVPFYNHRGRAERMIKEGKNAVTWTCLSCHDFADKQVRRQLLALACNLGNFLRQVALPKSVRHLKMKSLRERVIKIGAKVVCHARYIIFQMADVAVSWELFAAILGSKRRLRPIVEATG